jgi:cytochrome c553
MTRIPPTWETDDRMGGNRRRGSPVLAALLASLVLAGIATGAARADMIDTSGMKPWEVCALCHGLDGISKMSKFPRLAGQRRSYIEKQLRDFRAHRRQNDHGQMAAVVTEISEEDIPVVAAYFFGSKPPEPKITALGAAARARAKTLFEQGDAGAGIPACLTCHATAPKGPITAPMITAQHPEYLEKQLRDFRSGNRTNDATGSMPNIAGRLSEPDIVALAAYIAALPRGNL